MNHLLNYILTSYLVVLRPRRATQFRRGSKPAINPPRFLTGLLCISPCVPPQAAPSCRSRCPAARRGILAAVVFEGHEKRDGDRYFTPALARGAKRPLLEHVAQGQL